MIQREERKRNQRRRKEGEMRGEKNSAKSRKKQTS